MEIDWALIIEHWPFAACASILAVCGIVSDNIFTRERSYIFDKAGQKVGTRAFWYWMRATQPAHPLAVSIVLGFLMPFPEASIVSRRMTVLYYGGAGVAALAMWIWVRAKKKAGELDFPGESLRPPS